MTGMCSFLARHRLVVLGLAWLASTTEGQAALGQAVSSFSGATPVVTKSIRFSAVAPGQATSYTIQTVRLETGTVIHEYSSANGVVFAVDWRGPLLPDLSELLGSHFTEFKLEVDRLRLVGRRGSPVNMERRGLIVRSNGRMRNFFGHAYVSELLPSGFDVKDGFQ